MTQRTNPAKSSRRTSGPGDKSQNEEAHSLGQFWSEQAALERPKAEPCRGIQEHTKAVGRWWA